MRYEQQTIMNAAAMGSNQTSTILDLRNVIDLALMFTVTNAASPTGTVAIQFAEDCIINPNGSISGGTWGVDGTAPAAPTVTANGSKGWNMAELGHLFARVVFTAGTGTGNLTIQAGTKGA